MVVISSFLDIRFSLLSLTLGIFLMLRYRKNYWYPFWIYALLLQLSPLVRLFKLLPPGQFAKIEVALLAGSLLGASGLIWRQHFAEREGVSAALLKIQRRVFYKLPLLGALIAYSLAAHLGIGSALIFIGASGLISAFPLIRKNKIFWLYLGFLIFMTATFGGYYLVSTYRLIILNSLWVISFLFLMNVMRMLEFEGNEA